MKPQQNERWVFHLDHMLQAINRIEHYVAGLTKDHFVHDDKTIDAVIRNLEIIGEATHHIPNKICKHYQAIPGWHYAKCATFLPMNISMSTQTLSGKPLYGTSTG